jgi:hypothetical protein
MTLDSLIQDYSELTEIIWEIIYNTKFKSIFSDSSLFPSDNTFTLMLLYIITWKCYRAKGSWKHR